MAEFKYAPMFQLGPDTTEYYKLTSEGVSLGSRGILSLRWLLRL